MSLLVKSCFKPLTRIEFIITVHTIFTELLTARLAQTVERGTINPEVEGSSLSSGVKRGMCTRYVVVFDTG